MKSLPAYINEKLVIKQKQKIPLRSRQELNAAILNHFNNGDGDLNDIDVSKLKEEDFYALFFDLRDEIKENNIIEINISEWTLEELYSDNMSTGMFDCCETLEKIILPDCITEIGKYAFSDCTKLRNITIPNLVSTIGKWAFCNCSNLKSIIIPESVTSIGVNAFHGCNESKLKITVPNEDVKKLVEINGFRGAIEIQ